MRGAPTPTAARAAVGGNACQAALRALWPASTLYQALYVQHAEDGTGDPQRVSPQNWNGTYDIGCMQLNTVHLGQGGWTDVNQAKDARWNVAYALSIYRVRGWGAWSSVCGGLRPRPFSCAPPR